jgi:hypothetical protein
MADVEREISEEYVAFYATQLKVSLSSSHSKSPFAPLSQWHMWYSIM